jgi:thiol-disulfide isomerase/thioredoxin
MAACPRSARTTRRLARALTRRWVALALALALCLATAACGGQVADGDSSSPGAAGSSALDRVGLTVYVAGHRPAVPAVAGKTLQGHAYTSAQFVGDVIVVNVWASWCGPCREESPTLASLSRSLASEQVHFVGLDEADTRSAAIDFATSDGIGYPSVFDQNSSLLARLKVLPIRGIPSTMVLDRTGHLAGRIIGPVNAAELVSLIHQAEAS